jgi:hypothetical protein
MYNMTHVTHVYMEGGSMETSQIVIAVDRDTLRWFRAECIRRRTTPTKELARLMQSRLDEWLNDMAVQVYPESEDDVPR